MTRVKSILGFNPFPVTLLTVITYVSLFSALLYIDRRPPAVAKKGELDYWGVDVEEAWSDLEVLTRRFHPYNTRPNDDVRAYLLERIQEILSRNGVAGFGNELQSSGYGYSGTVELFDDGIPGKAGSNVTFVGAGRQDLTVYFEGTNIIVYIHGERPADELSPVLVSAHYDSVSTGYGLFLLSVFNLLPCIELLHPPTIPKCATDDGTAIVSILQIIKSFTRPESQGGKRLKRGLVALFNNGEEDYLNGARAFAMHPVAKLPHLFLNLEGAGAGGRATLFRSTDVEVTKYYKKAKRPFGTIVSGDGFKAGLIRSATDYSIFVENLGMRGLDVAFYQPRSRYHTTEDDARHSSKSKVFDSLNGDAGKGHDAVWFDLFGRAFSVLRLHTIFAFTITLIVVPFVVMVVTMWALGHSDKLYIFSNTAYNPPPPEHSIAAKTTQGWRGALRFPVAFIAATTGVVGMAFLINKLNPMIVYSSQYTVWICFLSTWWIIAWVILRGADAVRPTALARSYGFLEQWLLWFVAMIGVAVSIGKSHLGSGYWVLVFYSGIFISAFISLIEMTALQKKSEIKIVVSGGDDRAYPPEEHSRTGASENVSNHAADHGDDASEHATEETPLFRGPNRPLSFAPHRNLRYDNDHHDSGDVLVEEKDEAVYGDEQGWSKDLPSWTWIPQFLVTVPFQLILAGSVALLLGNALAQTGADGSGMLTVLLSFGIFSIILLLPVTPFLHRITYHVTLFIFVIFIGTFIYNLVAFPYSPNAKLKVYFQQTVDLQTGENNVHLVGHPDYINKIVSEYIPSAKGKVDICQADKLKPGLRRCSWKGIAPRVVPQAPGGVPPEYHFSDWISYNVTKTGDGKATITLRGRNTRACKLLFNKPVGIEVLNGHGELPRYGNLSRSITHYDRRSKLAKSPTLGDPIPGFPNTRELRLWSRDWERGWDVELTWEKEEEDGNDDPPAISTTDEVATTELRSARKRQIVDYEDGNESSSDSKGGLDGRVVCLWSDANKVSSEIPALEEVSRYLPVWAIASKLADGLVEGSVPFLI
ncbi:hypothetical protein L873DRAFT_739343 [Choiromyces venosus 120613-1]|uniref:Peptide hydrolase n=1 Tax=Choiromyces venosus 120613-1 TaxID=1336337 RepID=A0A3N4JRD1_9PEZI|nr:hypothetical protein L873DRAFT_739343 [Choiromyces venosus 120613-1]